MILPISYYGAPVLRETAEPVDSFDDNLKTLAANMVETMHDAAGIGLAGPQVGQKLRLFVMEIPTDMDRTADGLPLNPLLTGPLVVVNPEISAAEAGDPEEMEEGCLSIPDVRGNVVRPAEITMKYQDLEGKTHELILRGLAARCAQHETDHLNGVLFIDYLGSVKKMAIKNKLKKLKKQTLSEG